MLNDINTWTGADPHPTAALSEISRHSQRALSLIVRNRKRPALQNGFINILGAVEMLSGLEYHYENFDRICNALAAGDELDEILLNHAAVAYMNRMGQFFYFSISSFVIDTLGGKGITLPVIQKFLIFRTKHAAHRSIDTPRKGDLMPHQESHALSMSRFWGKAMILKPGQREFHHPTGVISGAKAIREFRRQQWMTCYPSFKIFDASTDTFLNFVMQTEHPKIASECYKVIEALVLHD